MGTSPGTTADQIKVFPKLEIETSGFYKKMVDEMSDDAQRMFGRFLDIEAGHIAAVQAELDYLSRTGYWLDFKEFDME